MWSYWGRWSSCSKSCGRGYEIRRRTIVKYARNGGKKCVGTRFSKRLCNRGRCPTGISGYFVFTIHYGFIWSSKLFGRNDLYTDFSIIFQAAETEIINARNMNNMVSVMVGMLHGCLEIARNHVISVKLLKLLVSLSVFEDQFAFSWRIFFFIKI